MGITHFVIKVTDNGVGFDPKAELGSGRSHVGIENTKKRLELMCGGTLDIESIIGRGTSVTIGIPKGDSNNESSSG